MRKGLWIAIIVLLVGASVAAYYYTRTKQARAKALPKSAKHRVFIVGLDGASWNLMKPLLKQGKLPNFQKLMESGSYGPLKSFTPTKSPILWTSIATGKMYMKHGIGSFTAEKDGKTIPVSGHQRITKA